jgi:predicted lipoprotein with Yx(FWY)xxD motif
MKRSVRGWGFRSAAVVVVGVLLLAACGKKSSITPASGGGSSGASVDHIATSNVSGLGTVISDGQGFTLYHLKTEVNGAIKCTGSCASVWPPLLVTGSGQATAGDGVSGQLGTVTRPDGGVQVTYDGLPLYTYSGDTAPGQANGQGIENVWFAITPSGSPAGSSSSGGGRYGSSSPTSGGYGY